MSCMLPNQRAVSKTSATWIRIHAFMVCLPDKAGSPRRSFRRPPGPHAGHGPTCDRTPRPRRVPRRDAEGLSMAPLGGRRLRRSRRHRTAKAAGCATATAGCAATTPGAGTGRALPIALARCSWVNATLDARPASSAGYARRPARGAERTDRTQLLHAAARPRV